MTYSPAQIKLHWASAGLVLVLAGTGLAYSFDLADRGALRFHQVLGQFLVILLIARIGYRLTRPAPAPHPDHSRAERALAYTVHIGLYLCLIAFSVTGYVSASALGNNAMLFPVDRGFARSDFGELLLEIHFALKWVLLALFTLHILGALKHAFWDRDRTLARMLSSTQ
ncbi:MAG: cytochrome b/b6 domain-containing protein [Pseudomonadota bacterium]